GPRVFRCHSRGSGAISLSTRQATPSFITDPATSAPPARIPVIYRAMDFHGGCLRNRARRELRVLPDLRVLPARQDPQARKERKDSLARSALPDHKDRRCPFTGPGAIPILTRR